MRIIVKFADACAGKPNLRKADRFFAMTNRLRSEGVDHLLAAADAGGVSHVVTQGHASMNGRRQGGWVKTEEVPLEDLDGTRAITHLEDAVVGAGGTVLRYGGFYGPGANDDQVALVRKGLFPLVGDGAGHFSWVHLDDAASATVLAVEQGVFNIVDDDPAPVREWLPYLAECAGARPPRRVPGCLARMLAGQMVVGMMTEGRGFSNARAKRELGWQLRYESSPTQPTSTRAFLSAVVTRVSVDVLRSARVRRAVFVLREVFGFGFPEIASAVGRSEAACRQLAVRARRHMDSGRSRFEADRSERDALAARFFDAVRDGDVDALRELLAADVQLVGDGGGKAPAFARSVFGADKVARVLASTFPLLPRIHARVEPRELKRSRRSRS